MEVKAKADTNIAVHQLPKLKSLLKKYRQVKTMQSGLLKLSELASTLTDMDAFYLALESVIKSLLITDSFHIVLKGPQQQLKLAYCHNSIDNQTLNYLEQHNWQNSLTSRVFESGDVAHCNIEQRKLLKLAGDIVLPDTSFCVDWLGVPLKRNQQVIGVIALKSYDTKLYFDDRDSQLLQFIAEHLVTAIDRVRSRELLEQKIIERTKKLTDTNRILQKEIAERQKVVKMQKALLAISEITATSLDLEHFYRELHQELNTLLPAKNLSIALLSQNNTWIDFPYCSDEKMACETSRRFANGLPELAVKEGRPLILSRGCILALNESGELGTQTCDSYYGRNHMSKAWLGAPLIDQGKVFGVLTVQDYQNEDAYQKNDLDIIRFVSQHIATAIIRKSTQAKIQQNSEELERMVDARTQELQASNLNLRMQIEERRKAEAQLYHDAHHDALTKLPNRAMFSDRLTYALRHLKRHPNHRFAVLFIDLDRFKMINDTLGHHAGDLFLVEIAVRLQECVRDNDILARLGGDEFVVLLDSLQTEDDVEEVAARIINAIEQPFELDGHNLYSNASIGIAMCNNQYKDANEILRDADAAMYQAKGLGRGRYVFFDDSMREQLIATMTLEQELRIAIKEKQFELHYQKISNLESTHVIGFEVLLRWHHPVKGLLTPSEFLFLAEETGMILEIENWVIEEVCLQLKEWQTSQYYQNAFIGINLSGRYLTQANQLSRLMDTIKKNTIEPQRLILEFNEKAFIQHTELALKGLRQLKEFGVKLALDDYGAGLSSLNFLHGYPFEFIKLDRSFIRTINNSDKNLSLVKALHELGDKFGYRLVAEGIESELMLNKLKDAGCDFGQGYHISRPSKMIKEVLPDNVIKLA